MQQSDVMAICDVLLEVKWWRFATLLNKTISTGLSNVHMITNFLTKQYQNNKHFSKLAPLHDVRTAGIDMKWRNYITVTSLTCYPMYT